MTRLTEVVKPKRKIEGERADYGRQVKGRDLEFTDWGSFTNEYGPGFIFQFWQDGVPYVFITHSEQLKNAAMAWERERGKEPFTAKVIEKKTKCGRTTYVFE